MSCIFSRCVSFIAFRVMVSLTLCVLMCTTFYDHVSCIFSCISIIRLFIHLSPRTSMYFHISFPILLNSPMARQFDPYKNRVLNYIVIVIFLLQSNDILFLIRRSSSVYSIFAAILTQIMHMMSMVVCELIRLVTIWKIIGQIVG